MAHCVAAYHFSCLLDEIRRAADIRVADASIQYLGFVMFFGFIPSWQLKGRAWNIVPDYTEELGL